MRNLPPVIIIGMHRSGTSMVTRALERLGLFVGRRKDENHEAVLFQRINDWILCQAGASWDNPAPVERLLKEQRIRSHLAEFVPAILSSRNVVSYMGLWSYLQHGSPFGLTHKWGWKDPRNTFTLPVWLDIFPEARVLHVMRHGVDVAKSLETRSSRGLDTSIRNFRIPKRGLNVPRNRVGFTDSLRCLTNEGAFSLWEEYMAAAANNTEHLGDRVLEVRYEDLLSRASGILDECARFCGLEPKKSAIELVLAGLKEQRAFAYRNDPGLVEFAEANARSLAAYGY